MLSRAFRNRFVELHFDAIPNKELETILHERSEIPLSYARRLVGVMLELQTRRRGSGVFAGKTGFMTLRDLFRWAQRYKCPELDDRKFYNWDKHLADQGNDCERNSQATVIHYVLSLCTELAEILGVI
ncbi:hypothetical protein DPMN_054700 [Dreissena polymorpha]|uniref:Midasin AAA lid domain-containing protein n=1 Tax=Dreissena polymorpha TaxID=45954 RepID=A0A9D4HRI2_DREPO|nr:hypothetical protein DPMN_054700 [Dreissena polymorpha]